MTPPIHALVVRRTKEGCSQAKDTEVDKQQREIETLTVRIRSECMYIKFQLEVVEIPTAAT